MAIHTAPNWLSEIKCSYVDTRLQYVGGVEIPNFPGHDAIYYRGAYQTGINVLQSAARASKAKVTKMSAFIEEVKINLRALRAERYGCVMLEA